MSGQKLKNDYKKNQSKLLHRNHVFPHFTCLKYIVCSSNNTLHGTYHSNSEKVFLNYQKVLAGSSYHTQWSSPVIIKIENRKIYHY